MNAKCEIQSAKPFDANGDITENLDRTNTEVDNFEQSYAQLKNYLDTVVDPSPTMKRRKQTG
ncbi:MAG: hypothetical protein VX694_04170 [Planctomycetota bacterium]|nr:hypothetical protein [Planctomycetota bacterium]